MTYNVFSGTLNLTQSMNLWRPHELSDVPPTTAASALQRGCSSTLGVIRDRHLALSHCTSNVCNFAGLLIFTYALFVTSELHLLKTWLIQSLSQWFTHCLDCLRCANSVVHGLTNVKGLKSVQISVARVVFKNNPNCLLVNSCLKFKIAGITYGALTTGQPAYLHALFNGYSQRTLRSANQYFLQQPWVSTELAKKSFSCLGPKIWNNIPLDIWLSHTLPTPKRLSLIHIWRCRRRG